MVPTRYNQAPRTCWLMAAEKQNNVRSARIT